MLTQEEKTAFNYCTQIAKAHYENFPVGSLLIPKAKQKYVHAIYAFARIADDFADELDVQGDRIELLDDWLDKLSNAYLGKADHPVFIAICKTAQDCAIPESLLQDLIAAFKMDVRVKRHLTFDDLLYYCKHSANPIGRLILLVFGHQNEQWNHYSDTICTALQLANFWQDISIDILKDRIYIPQEDLAKFNLEDKDIFNQKINPNVQALMKFQVDRTRDLFQQGWLLCQEAKPYRLKLELKTIWYGGVSILNRIEKNEYNVFQRPSLTKADFIKLFFQVIFR